MHNVYIVQYVFLPTEQSETYFKNFILTYDLTYICPGLFDWKENTFFFIFVKSNSKSGRFSSFLMPNNFGTGQKKGLFFRCFRKLNHGQRTTFIKGRSPDSKKTPPKSWTRGYRTVQCTHCAMCSSVASDRMLSQHVLCLFVL